MTKNRENEGKYHFLLRNLFRGVLVFAAFVLVYILFRKFGGSQYLTWLEPVYSKPALVFSIYAVSELFFGIITPEIFMVWGLEQGGTQTYIYILIALMLISYIAGYINYWIGRLFRKVTRFRWFIQKRMQKYSGYLAKFGGFLLIVAATTPLPFSAVCLVVGSVHYSHKKFLLFTLTRLARFAVYGFLVWQARGV